MSPSRAFSQSPGAKNLAGGQDFNADNATLVLAARLTVEHHIEMLIKVRKAKPLGDYRLAIKFSDDTMGERDFSFITSETGPMLQPLKDPTYFRRLFVENGAITWPNGYDWDPIALHDEMKAAGELRPVGDAAE